MLTGYATTTNNRCWSTPYLPWSCASSKSLNADLELKSQANVLCYMQLLLSSHRIVWGSFNLHRAQVDAGVSTIFTEWRVHACSAHAHSKKKCKSGHSNSSLSSAPCSWILSSCLVSFRSRNTSTHSVRASRAVNVPWFSPIYIYPSFIYDSALWRRHSRWFNAVLRNESRPQLFQQSAALHLLFF